MLSKGNISWIFSGSIIYCSVACHPVRVIWYLNSSTLTGVVAILILPGWWNPTTCYNNANKHTSINPYLALKHNSSSVQWKCRYTTRDLLSSERDNYINIFGSYKETFIHQLFTKCLLCARHYAKPQRCCYEQERQKPCLYRAYRWSRELIA